MIAPLLAVAVAAAPEILLPPWPLSPDGDDVAVRGGAALAVEGGEARPVGGGLYRVVPPPGARSVRLSAGAAQVVAEVAPPPGEIAVTLRPASAVKGRDSTIALELVMPAAGAGSGAAPPPVVVASSGRVRDLAPAGPGRYVAVYEPAPTLHPEVGVILALAPRCPLCSTPLAIGHAVVALSAAIELPGRAEPGTRTTVTVGGATFGPAAADRSGRFSVPLVVPPGARIATAVAVDRLGNRRTTRIDLRLPEVDRLACAAWPRAIPADGRGAADVWCVASTAAGAPAPGARLQLAATQGEVEEAAPFRGALQRARLRAPAGGGGRDAVVTATYRDGASASRDELRIALATGAPAAIEATLEREPVAPGATVAAVTAVRDAAGDVLGRPAGPPGATEGFVAPERFVARATAGDLVQEAPLSFALAPGGVAATLRLRRERGGWLAEARTVDGRPAAGVPVRFGSGLAAVTDARGEARAAGTRAAETVEAEGGARAAGWEEIAPPPAPFEVTRTVRVPLRPPTAVDVVARLDGRTLRWRVEDGGGAAIEGRAVTLRASGVQVGPVERDGAGGRCTIAGGPGAVAVVDVETGVAAVVEVP